MKTVYLVWKDPTCKGVNPQWQTLNRRDFLTLVRAGENKGRCFIRLEGTEPDGSGAIVIEATKAAYADWKREKNHTDYLRKQAQGTSVVSYHALESEEGAFGEDVLLDTDCDIEADFILSQEPVILQDALSLLSDEEQQMMHYLYLSDVPGTVRGYEEMTGTSKSTASRRHQAILMKLKKFFEK